MKSLVGRWRGRPPSIPLLPLLVADAGEAPLADVLEAQAVVAHRRGWSLDGVTLEVVRRKSVGIYGRPSVGLTSLAGIIAGVRDAPRLSSGRVLVDGRPRRTLRGARPEVGFIPAGASDQLARDHGSSTVRSVLAADLVRLGVPSAVVRRSVAAVVADIGLAAIAEHGVDHLTRVDRARVCVARELAKWPAFLVVDEPDFGLNLRLSVASVNYLLSLCRRMNVGLVFTTHTMSEALAADHAFELRSGRLAPMTDEGPSQGLRLV